MIKIMLQVMSMRIFRFNIAVNETADESRIE